MKDAICSAKCSSVRIVWKLTIGLRPKSIYKGEIEMAKGIIRVHHPKLTKEERKAREDEIRKALVEFYLATGKGVATDKCIKTL